MRIVYVLTSPGVGGAERLTLELATRMKEPGHAVLLVTLRTVEEQLLTELTVSSLDMRETPLLVIASLLRARRLLRAFRPDVVHSHGFHANIFARALRMLSPVPALISTVHNVYEGGWLRMRTYPATNGLSDCTTAVSEAVARRFLESGAISRQRCVWHGCSSAKPGTIGCGHARHNGSQRRRAVRDRTGCSRTHPAIQHEIAGCRVGGAVQLSTCVTARCAECGDTERDSE